jgi:TatD DNase family protein
VQLHAYDGKASSAGPAVEAGFFFSIPPSVVRSQQKVKLVRRLPTDCLLLESDSPVLGPDPGRRNEPDSVITVLNAIAEIKGMNPEQVRRRIDENTVRLYGNCINPQPA